MSEEVRQKWVSAQPQRRRAVVERSRVPRPAPRRRVPVVAWVILLLALVVAAGLALPALLRVDRVSALVLRGAESMLGYRIEAAALRLAYVPTFQLVLDGVRVTNRRTAAVVASADRAGFGLSPFAAFTETPAIRWITIDGLEATVTRDVEGRWGVVGAEPLEPASQAPAQPTPFAAWPGRISVREARIAIVDQTPTADFRFVQLTEFFASVERDRAAESLRVVLASQVTDAVMPPIPVTFVGRVMDPTRDHFGGLQRKTVLDGMLQIQELNPWALAKYVGLEAGAGPSWPMKVTVQVEVLAGEHDTVVQVPQWTMEAPDLALQGRTTIGLGEAGPQWWVSVSSTAPLYIAALMDHVPDPVLPDAVRALVHDYQPTATIDIPSLTMAGDLSKNPPTVVGHVRLANGRAVVNGELAHEVSADVQFDPGQVRLEHLAGKYGGVTVTGGTARLHYLTPTQPLDVTVIGDAQADQVLEMLPRLMGVEAMRSVSSVLQTASGRLHLTAHAAGPLGSTGVRLEEVRVTTADLVVRTPSIPWDVEHISGAVSYVPSLVQIDDVRGRAGPAELRVQGKLDLAGQPAFKDFTVEADGAAHDLSRLVPAIEANPGLTFDGRLRSTVSLAGHVQAPRFRAHLDLAGVGFVLRDLLTKAEGRPASLDVTGALDETQVTVDRLVAAFPPAVLHAQGMVGLKPPWSFEAAVEAPALDVATLGTSVSLGPLRRGTVKAAGRVTGVGSDWRTWHTWGRVDLEKGLLAAEALHEPLEDVVVAVQATDQRIDVEEIAGTYGQSHVRLTGVIEHWLDAPEGTLVLEAPNVNVKKLLSARPASSTNEPNSGVVHTWLHSARINATAFADYLYYDRLLLTGFSTRMQWDHGVLNVHEVSADTDAGHLSIHGLWDPPEERPGAFRIAGRLTGMPIPQATSLFVPAEDPITGWLSFKGEFRAGVDEEGVMRKTVSSGDHDVTILLEQGQIRRFPVVARLLTVLNLPALLQGHADIRQGVLPYDRMLGRVTIKDGMMTVQELFVDSPILKISATGTYDLAKDHLNLVLATSPLGSYADLLKQVPLFGKLLAGERQGLDTALFAVTGPLTDPSVTYQPIASLARGLTGLPRLAIDVLVNALTLPRDLTTNLFKED